MSADAPQLVTTEIPEEVARMEAALQRERQERAAQAARDAQIAAAINDDMFMDAEPVSMGAPISITGAMSTPLDVLDDVKDIDVDLYSNKEVIEQNKENYNIEIAHSRDHRGKHYWCFDDRHAMPFVIIAFRTRKSKWLCIINDNIIPLSKFLSITEVCLGAQQRREFGAPATAPTLRTLICKTSTGEELTFNHATVGHIMAALQTISDDPDADYKEEEDGDGGLETIVEVDGDDDTEDKD